MAEPIRRRSMIQLALGLFPLALLGDSEKGLPSVAAGADRYGENRIIGVSTSAFKVSTADSGGDLFVMEHKMTKKGGPPRHLHHTEDEYFYALEGEYIVEVGSDRFHLKSGDSLLAKRQIPHAWAFVGDTPGRLLISFAPAGKMEAFFTEMEKRREHAYGTDAEFHRRFGLELIGPPIKIG